MVHISPQREKPQPSMELTKTIGRNLFGDIVELKAKMPGPGSYDVPFRRYSSHCYIKKEEEFIDKKIAKRLRKRQLINECRGPGIYNPEQAFESTSKSKSAAQGKIAQGNFARFIMPSIKMENLYLASSGSAKHLYNANLP